jgi:hypothetical protein
VQSLTKHFGVARRLHDEEAKRNRKDNAEYGNSPEQCHVCWTWFGASLASVPAKIFVIPGTAYIFAVWLKQF